MLTFTLKQLNKHYWVILDPKGKEFTPELYFDHREQAEDYCRAFISYHRCVTYNVVLCDKIKTD